MQNEYTAQLESITAFQELDIIATDRYDPKAQIVRQDRFRSEYHELCYKVMFELRSFAYCPLSITKKQLSCLCMCWYGITYILSL